MPNLIKDLGVDYFNGRYLDKLFVKGDTVYMPSAARSSSVECVKLASLSNPEIEARWARHDPEKETFPADFFSDFEVFSYPVMGGRRLGGSAYRVSRRTNRVFSSGASLAQLTARASNATSLLEAEGLIPPLDMHSGAFLRALMFPQYDDKSVLSQTLEGKSFCYMPNNRVLVEPNVRNTYNLYDVFVDGMRIGSLTPDGVISRNTPPQNKVLMEKVLS